MSNLKHIFYIACITLTVTACQESPHSVSYLLQHPRTLEKDIRFCMSDDSKSESQTSYCNVVVEAKDKIRNYLDDEQMEPEKFGQRIMETEAAYAQLKTEFSETKQQLNILQTKKAPQSELQPIQEKLITMERSYRDKQKKLKILLAIVGLSSP